jgi:penicillin amidase
MRRILRLFRRLAAALALLVLLAASAIAGAIWLSLPGGDLTATIPGLQSKVDITLDTDGVPRVTAQNERDAAAALGFLHARERLFQMDLMRRAARGELSEIAGTATLPLDRLNRTLNLRDHAADDLTHLDPDTKAILDSYAAGVNAWIAQRGRFSALEFVLLGTPRPWTAQDSLLWAKTMGMYLSGNWRAELARFQLAATLSRPQIEALWPNPPTSAEDAWLTPTAGAALRKLTEILPRFPDPFTLPDHASNEWAVDGTHSATGHPLLAGDPHLAFGLPGIWYLARIDLPDGVRAGATAPGVPFLVIGHNGHIAWTFTSTGADVQDIFLEQPQDDGYATETGPRPFASRDEIIHIRGTPDEILHVRETRHGPLISDLIRKNGPLLAVEMANLAPGDTASEGLLALNRAHTVAEAAAAAPRITSPVQNMLVADADSIGFFLTGRVPLRRSGSGAFVARGDDGSADWIGWAQGDQLPHITNPASGRLVNANERPAPPDFPINLGRDWPGDARARRIRQMLDQITHPTVQDFVAMQSDATDLIAVDLLPRLRKLAPLFADWNGQMTRERPQPLLFTAWMTRLDEALLNRAGVPPRADAAVPYWPDFVHAALGESEPTLCGPDCDAILASTYQATMTDLAARFGPDPTQWHWGDAHQAVFAHPILGRLPVLGPLTTARIEQDGGDSTVGRGGTSFGTMESIHGAAFRGVYDLSNLDRSRFMITPGESGDVASPLARNFVRPWRDGGTILLTREAADIAAHIRLSP